MDLLLSFSIPALPPSVNKIYSRSRYGVFKNSCVTDFQKEAMRSIRKRPYILSEVVLIFDFYIKRDRDIDNFLKVMLDTIQLLRIIKNDSQVIAVIARKIKSTNEKVSGQILNYDRSYFDQALKYFLPSQKS